MKKIKPLLLLLGLVFVSGLMAQNVEFENIQIINGERLDFSPIPYGSGLMFTSSKSDRFLKCPEQNNGDYTDIYFSRLNDSGVYEEPVKLKGGVNGKYNDGVPTFTPDGNTMYFTRNDQQGKNDKDTIDLKVYVGDLVDGKWENVEEFFHSGPDFSTAHPTLSSDGKLLIFSSNRPGSMGGSMDLWGTRKLDDDVWSIPFPLGPEINTTENEIFPFLDSEGNLFFSSNGHGGEGQLDIFAAINADPENEDEWDMVGNIGTPFNSPMDEVGFVPLNGATEGFLASDNSLSGAEGMDDIYKWTRESDMMPALIQVVDKGTGKPLENATVNIDPTSFQNPSIQKYGPVLDMLYGGEGPPIALEPLLELKTDAEGMLPAMRVYPGSNFNIDAGKSGYIPEVRTPTTEELVENEVYVIPLERKFATLIVCVVEDDPGNAPIPTADIVIRNKRTGEEVNQKGDGEGCTRTQIDCRDDYYITAGKEPYERNDYELTDYDVECEGGEVRVTIKLKKPLIVILEPIFFNFDRYYIRKKDARPTLDSLAKIMEKYPSLQIRLGAHCDARGSTKYNDILGQNRANSAKKYLVKINDSFAERITTEDFGERDPINECKDDVYCPEADHQLNRRVDVIPVSHNEPRVLFQTRDVSTMNVESDRKDPVNKDLSSLD